MMILTFFCSRDAEHTPLTEAQRELLLLYYNKFRVTLEHEARKCNNKEFFARATARQVVYELMSAYEDVPKSSAMPLFETYRFPDNQVEVYRQETAEESWAVVIQVGDLACSLVPCDRCRQCWHGRLCKR